MSTTNENTVQEKKGSDITFSDIISWTFSHKAFIGISIFCCLFLAAFYIYRSLPVYDRESSVMIRSDLNGNAQIGELAAFSDLGMFSTGVDVMNEIEAFRSPLIMQEVVKRLKININYISHNWLGKPVDLYQQTPVVASFDNILTEYEEHPVTSVSFRIRLDKDSTTLILDKFKANDEKIKSEALKTLPDRKIKTPIADIHLSKTLFFGTNFEDPITISWQTVDSKTKDCIKQLSLELADKNATVINFYYSDTSDKRAEDILNTLLDAYNEDWMRYMNKSAMNTSKFINERLIVIEKELGAADSDVEKFKSNNKLLDVQTELLQVTNESTKYSEQTFEVSNQLSIAKFIREYLVDQTKAFDLLPANSGIENPNIEYQIAEYNTMLLTRQRLVDNSSNSNPLVADLNNQLTMMRSTILRSVENLINTLQIEVDKLTEQENEISDRITANPGKVRELLSIERQQKIKESLYLYLLQKREENELQTSITVNNTRLLKPATGEPVPSSPRKSIILLAALIFGLAIPYGYMYIRLSSDKTLRGRVDLETLSAPIVGEIPQIGKPRRFEALRKMLSRKKEEDRPPYIVVKPHSRDIINEAYRVMRTNLDFMMNTCKGPQVIMLTSYNAGSGKTFTSLNLAACMAIKGKRVIIVDLDIRKGTFSKSVNSPRKGIVSYLNRQTDDLSAVTVKNAFDINGLDVLPVGTLPPNPAELLLDSRMDDAIADLRKHYDYVFLDCPPIDVVADTAIIARVADRSLFVVRVGVLDRRTLPDIEKIYTENRLPNMAIIINGCKQSSGIGYNRYSYGYGRYGYGDNYSAE